MASEGDGGGGADLKYRECSDPECGRYLVATRDILAGEEVFTEVPVALGPLPCYDLICLGCHEHLGPGWVPCVRCKWPVCSVSCSDAPQHKLECYLLATDYRHIGPPKEPGATVRYDIILPLRCLLLQHTNPSDWLRVADMASHAARRMELQDDTHRTTTRYITEALDTDFNADDVHHVHDAIVSNCFECRTASFVRLRGMYPLMARMNHSCVPNVTLLADTRGTMTVRAAVDIAAGQELSITYLGTSVPRWDRQQYTREVHFFTCQCARCRDPSELGLHYSSPRCPSCPGGYLLPSTRPQDTTWTCPGCGASRDEADVRQQAEEWTARLLGPDLFPTDSPSSVGAVLAKVEATFHGRHFVWEKVAQVAVKVIKSDKSLGGMTLRRDVWRRLLGLYDVMEPGLTRRRGVTLSEVGVAELLLARALRDTGEYTPEAFKQQVHEALVNIRAAVAILQLETEDSPEIRWLTRARLAEQAALDDLEELEAEGESSTQQQQQPQQQEQQPTPTSTSIAPPTPTTTSTTANSTTKKRMTEGLGKCGMCGAEARQKCGGCGDVSYCGRDHQREHWPKHRGYCTPIRKVKTETGGRHYVASRDLGPGQLTIEEEPLILGPAGTSYPVCLGCHAPIDTPELLKCPGCAWPLCSLDCQHKEPHKSECDILARDVNHVGPPAAQGASPKYDLILVLRILLMRENNPESWKKIMELEGHEEQRREQAEEYHMAGVKFMTDIIKVEADDAVVHKVRGVMITNCVNVTGSRGEYLRGIYPNIAQLNHSCVPNVCMRSDINNKLVIHTTVPVKRGEPLYFSYLAPEEPIWARNFDLTNIYFFKCQCTRCSDPTEFGTHYSSPRCAQCPAKYVEALDGPDAPWRCSECSGTREPREIEHATNSYLDDVQERVDAVTEVSQCRALMTEIEKKFHGNHYVWLTVAQQLMKKLRGNVDVSVLRYRQEVWRKLLRFYEIFEPGTTRRRGVTLCQLSELEIMIAKVEVEYGDLSPDSYVAALTSILANLDQAAQIMNLEPEGSKEIRFRQRAMDLINIVTRMLHEYESTKSSQRS